jgi:hypothetical protein
MTAFTSGPDFWDPNDSTTKECGVEGADPNGAIVRTTSTVTISTDATAMAALPAGHSVSRFVRANDDHQGTFFAGHGQSVSASFVRVAARWYIWHTPTFDFKLEGSCENSKIAQMDFTALIDYTEGFHTYGYQGFTPSEDCCISGPGPGAGLASSEMKGKWWRWEVVLTNRSGPDFRVQMYGKNVTDDEAEIEIIDLWDDPRVDNLTPPGLMSAILSNNHRFSSSGTCRGWIGLSHYMYAGWTADAGQRIGAAEEIEGEGGSEGGGGGQTNNALQESAFPSTMEPQSNRSVIGSW